MKASIPHIYNQSLALLTDFYQLTMAYGYWKLGMHKKEAVFHHFFRKKPFNGGFTIAAGLERFIDFLENFHFDPSDLAYLESLKADDGTPYFSSSFLDYLAQLKFTCHIDAVPEGTVVFPFEPMIRVQGPLIQCQLLESPLLNIMNFSTLIATKSARMCLAARGDAILEFGMRRAQGIDGAITASRSAYIGGCTATSNVLAGKLFNIPVKGTHAHSWVMVFDDELESFKAYASAMSNNCVFLVDTYNTLEGVKKAIEVGLWLKSQGKAFLGIRLDSGDLAYLSIESRKLLDAAGFSSTKIFASNELDETIIGELKSQGAQIAVWGVGTSLVTGKDQPALDGVYKLSAIRDPGAAWKYKLKLSEQMTKVSNPGILQVRRYANSLGNIADVIYDIHSDIEEKCTLIDPLDLTRQREIQKEWKKEDLLVPIFRDGQRVYILPALSDIQKKVKCELDRFHVSIKRFLNPHQYVVGMEKSLFALKLELIGNIRGSQSKVAYKVD